MKVFELISIVLISGSLGFYLGHDGKERQDKRPSSALEEQAQGHRGKGSNVVPVKATQKQQSVHSKAAAPELNSFSAIEEILSGLDNDILALSAKESQLELLKLYGHISNLQDHEFMDLYYALAANADLPFRKLIERHLFQEWGEKNYDLAMSFLQDSDLTHFHKRDLEKQMVLGLSRKKPLKAFSWFLAEQERQKGEVGGWNGFLLELFKTHSANDLDDSLSTVDEVKGAKNKVLALQGIVGQLDESSRFINLLEKYDASEYIAIRNRALKKWGEVAAEDSIDWVQSHLQGEEQKKALQNITKSWLKTDPQKAATWEIENSVELEQSYRLIVQNWDRQLSDDLELWLEGQADSSGKDEAYKELVNKFIVKDYKKALKYWDLIQGDVLKRQVKDKIYRIISWQDKSLAESVFKK